MVRVRIVVRKRGTPKPDYSLVFELPELPGIGDYISIHRPDCPEPYGEDIIVRHIWWRLDHPEAPGVVDRETEKIGGVHEICVECDQALGPYPSARWRKEAEFAKQRGVAVEVFDIARYSVRESELPKA